MANTLQDLVYIRQLYTEATDRKLMAGGAAIATTKLIEAETLADMVGEAVPRSLLALIQLRLGHLTLREGRTHEDWLIAEEYFANAAHAPGLAGVATPFRLACLYRMAEAPEQRAAMLRKAEAVWLAAAGAATAKPTHDDENPAVLQSTAFNLLELATVFLGKPTEALRRHVQEDPSEGGALVLERGAVLSANLLPYCVAEDIARCQAELATNTIVLALPPGTTRAHLLAPSGARCEIGWAVARFLAFLIVGGRCSHAQMVRDLAGGDVNARVNDGYRATLSRARTALGSVAAVPAREAILDSKGETWISPAVRITGAADATRLRFGQA